MNDSLYEDYMRSVLGYNSMNTYDMNYSDMMPNSVQNFSNMQNQELEMCYPDIYKMVYPMVQKICRQNTRPLTRELIDNMTDEIYFSMEDSQLAETRATETNDNKVKEAKSEDRQRIVRDRTLNDLIRILILRELLGRPGFPGRPPRPPMRPPRPPMRPPMGPRPRPGMGPFNRQSYDVFDDEYDIYEY